MDWSGVQGCIVKDAATLTCIPALFGQLFSIAISFAGIVALFFVIWGGYKFIRSGGDPKQLEAARHTITYAVIGLIVILSALLILRFVSTVTGVECIRVFGFTNCGGPSTSSSSLSFCEENVGLERKDDGTFSCQCDLSTSKYVEGNPPMCIPYCSPQLGSSVNMIDHPCLCEGTNPVSGLTLEQTAQSDGAPLCQNIP